MEDLIQALKSYKSMAADMAEFADEDHLERNDKIAVVIKLQNGVAALLKSLIDAACERQPKDFFAVAFLKSQGKTLGFIKDKLHEISETNDQAKLWSRFSSVEEEFGIFIKRIETEADSDEEDMMKRAFGAMYFNNEIK